MFSSNLCFIKYLFVSSILLSNIIAAKIIDVGGLILPAAIILYPFTFLFTDVVSEIEGRKKAQDLVMMGFYMSLIMVLIIYISQILPPASFWEQQKAYNIILGSTPRIVLASMIAYLISQNHDVWAFHWWKDKTSGKYLWIRNNFSTIISQLIDSVLFIGIAFGGIYTAKSIAIMIFSQYLIKVGIAILDTPFCYILVRIYGNYRKQVQKA
ncbi:MAG: queuosine precursor transporter [Syntrophobacterales bacterium]|nr:queuosine precursor transporter [Syntrophobacterales bacterium]